MPDSRLHRLLLAIAGVGLLYFLWRSIAETWGLCDFEVYWATAVRVLDGKVDFYEVPSPVKLRNFFYPPSAAVLLAPLGMVSQPVAGVVWSLLKTVALALLIRVGVDTARGPAPSRLGLGLITALLALRPITSDFGNGQVNTLVAGLAALGCVGLMSPRRGRVVGGAFALATAVALKATPGLLLLLPLLQRRWRAAGWAVGATLLLVLGLPAVVFGPATTVELFGRFERGSSSLVDGIGGRDRQVSLNEVILFGLAQAQAVQAGAAGTEDQAPDGVSAPLSAEQRRLLWLAQVGGVLGLVLLGRWKLLGGRPGWQWDLATLSLLMLLLAPMVRGAHLVLLIVPFGWLVCRFREALRSPVVAGSGTPGGAPEAGGEGVVALGSRRVLMVLGSVTVLLTWGWKAVVVPLPGAGARAAHPGLFLALLGSLALMFLAAPRIRLGAPPPGPGTRGEDRDPC